MPGAPWTSSPPPPHKLGHNLEAAVEIIRIGIITVAIQFRVANSRARLRGQDASPV
jgi:hypothetical protein